MRRNKQIDIKGALALAAAFHFLCCCGRACVLPFLTLYFRQLGLTPAMTGIIMGTKHLISLFWSPLATLLSKHYNRRRVVIIGSLICSAAAALVVLLIPSTRVEMLSSHCNVSDLSATPTGGLGDHGLIGSVRPTMASTVTRSKVNTDFVSQSDDMQTLNDTKPAPVLMSEASLYTLNQEVLVNKTSHLQLSHMNVSAHPQLSQMNVSAHPQLSQMNVSAHPQLSQMNVSVAVNNSAGEPDTDRSVIHQLNVTSPMSPPVRRIRSLIKSKSADQQQMRAEEPEAHFEFLGSLKVMDVQHQLFFLLLIVVSIWEAVSAPLEWTADDGLYEYLDFVDATDRYGSTRTWGLLGAACGVGAVGLLVSHLSCLIGGGDTPRSAVHFFCYAALTALALPLAALLPLYLNKKRDRANGLLKAMQLVRGHPRALLCAVTTFLVGIAGSAVENFLLWQMQDHGSSELHIGVSLALALLSQAAFPLLAGRVSKLLSPGRVLIVAAGSLALQCLYYSFLWAPWAVLPAQLLSCFSSGALWWAVQVQCEDVTTPGAERSVKRVYQGLFPDLGLGLGSFAGGFVVQRFGVAWLFRGVAVILALWCVTCLPLLQWKAPRQRRINYSRLLAADASEASDSESEQERDWLDKAMEEDKSNNNYGRRINQ